MSEGPIELAEGQLLVEQRGSVGHVVFNRPQRHNAISVEIWAAIPLALDRLEGDAAIRSVVLSGAGEKSFISGADISQFEKRRSSSEVRGYYDSVAGTANRRLIECPLPTVAMIQGYCIGGGLGVALNCDLRYASSDSSFGIPAARLGVGYHHNGVRRLIDVVGPSFAKEIFYTARRFDASEAQAMGLVNRVVERDELAALVDDTCGRIAENAPLTVRSVKTIVGELVRGGHADLELCEQVVRDCFGSEDYVEGRRAFMDKRKPVFVGR
ncbi:MAG: enoyl-CoA hydratase [Acidobacteriota bacterium]|nr:enoyl-CoA hydratase [Acidobacteriota bacterium]